MGWPSYGVSVCLGSHSVLTSQPLSVFLAPGWLFREIEENSKPKEKRDTEEVRRKKRHRRKIIVEKNNKKGGANEDKSE